MNAEEDTPMRIAWGHALIAIGLVIAFLALGALEVLTARLPDAPEGLAAAASTDHAPVRPWWDSLDTRGSGVSETPGVASVTERGETHRAVAVGSGGSRLP
jgi:hypothetical protein